MQQLTCKMVWPFSFYLLFVSWNKNPLVLVRSPGEVLKVPDKARKSVEKREKAPRRFCALVLRGGGP